jgi:hypothetical protein
MKRCFLLLFAASLAWAQTTPTAQPGQTAPPAAPGGSGAATSGLKLRGPEAVAEADPTRVVAIIHGEKITAAEAQKLLKRLPPDQVAKIVSPEQMEKALENVYLATKLAVEGEKLKLEDASPWKEQLDNFRISILANAYVKHLTEEGYNPTDADISKYYADHNSDYEQLKLSAIFVSFTPAGAAPPAGAVSRTQDDAKAKAADVVARARNGGDFAALAKMDSDDKASGGKGGDIGSINAGKNNLPKDIGAVVVKMKKGEISDPVEQRNGYYIFLLNDRVQQTLDEVKPQIVDAMRSDHNKQIVQNVVSEYKIQVQDSDFFTRPGPPRTPSIGPGMPGKTPSLQNPPPHQ